MMTTGENILKVLAMLNSNRILRTEGDQEAKPLIAPRCLAVPS